MTDSERGAREHEGPPLGTAAAALAGFLGLFHYVGLETWGHGKITFVRMLGLLAIVVLTPALARLESRIGTTRLLGMVLLGYAAARARGLYVALRDELARPDLAQSAIDIARNTYEAGTQFLAGKNPYAERCQLGHEITSGPHVTVGAEGVRMYGLRYPYGFPYFPVMMLVYLPFRGAFEGMHAIRAGNGVFLALGCLGAAWLAARSVPRGRRTLAAGMACTAFLGIEVLAPELFHIAVTDGVVALFAVFAFVALAHEQVVLAGVFLGLAQASKLLPGPLLVLPALVHLGGRTQRLRLVASYVAVSAAFLVPPLVRDAEAFVSSTIAFYLTYHGEGDDTSLYWYLPAWAKGPFLGLGAIVALAAALSGLRFRTTSAGEAAGRAWLAYFAFTTFNRMTHLNYLWGIHTLGAVAIATVALAPRASRLIRPTPPLPRDSTPESRG